MNLLKTFFANYRRQLYQRHWHGSGCCLSSGRDRHVVFYISFDNTTTITAAFQQFEVYPLVLSQFFS